MNNRVPVPQDKAPKPEKMTREQAREQLGWGMLQPARKDAKR